MCTVFLLKIRHLLFFGTLSLKCVLNLQISASTLVLRHSKPTAQCEKSCTSWKRAVDAFSFKTRVRHHTSNYSALLELLPQLLPNIGQANMKNKNYYLFCAEFLEEIRYEGFFEVCVGILMTAGVTDVRHRTCINNTRINT